MSGLPKMHHADGDWLTTLCGKPITGNLRATYSAPAVTCVTCRRANAAAEQRMGLPPAARHAVEVKE